MTDVIMPQMGESIAEGTITKWLKNVGDKVERDEPLFEISTDKVDAEIPAPAAGVLVEIRVAAGATVAINTVVGIIGEAGTQVAAPAPVAAAAPPSAPTPLPVPPPPAFSTPPVAMTAAAAPAVPPPVFQLEPPTLRAVPPPTPAPTPAPAPAAAPAAPAAATPEKARAEMSAEELRQSRSSPVVRKIAAEHNIDVRELQGTGISGRVTKQDILGHLEGRTAPAPPEAPMAAPAAADPPFASGAPAPTPVPAPPVASPTPPRPTIVPPPAPAPAPAPVSVPAPAPPPPTPPAAAAPRPAGGARVEVVPLSPIRKKTAEHMVLSKRTSAHVATVFEIDMSHVERLRGKYRAGYEERSGVKLTYLPFILKATVDALRPSRC